METSQIGYQDVLESLKKVLDPEIGLNIVDLGLIYEINIHENIRQIRIAMTLTTQFCPMGNSIMESVKQVLMKDFPEFIPIVSLTFVPEWTPELISEEGQRFLGKAPQIPDSIQGNKEGLGVGKWVKKIFK
ncbi:MAG: metal-sulfur cluster assembly factor [Cyclobacteriaceae bacterium]|nr:metal-sulfur cluster assembly factor [Cyclobacteriaceae bacterium]